jgi:hypothetical protein
VRRLAAPASSGLVAGEASPGTRAFIVAMTRLLWLIWYLVGPLSLRIAFSLLLILLLPVFVTVTFDRKV